MLVLFSIFFISTIFFCPSASNPQDTVIQIHNILKYLKVHSGHLKKKKSFSSHQQRIRSANIQVFRAEITYELHDSSLRDGITCIDYELENKTTYGNCITSALHAKYLDVMGCFPPWMPGSQNR